MWSRMSRFFAGALFLGILQSSLALTQSLPSDSTSITAAVDSTGRLAGIDTIVVYKAQDSITYSLRTRHMKLYGSGDIKYRTMGLQSGQIDINWDTATLKAIGRKDTSDKMVEKPVMIDGGEKYNGSEVTYNFRTKRGRITVGETEMDNGYYHGEEIKRMSPQVLFVENGRYTTCDLDHPHFYFMSPRMKVIPREVVIAEPVFFYIADVPVFALPFGVFPNRSGRHSGIIAPAYGEDTRFGRYFTHFGYYWAASDYFDLGTTFDWYTRGGWANRSLVRYKLRYYFDGSVSASFNRRYEGEIGDPDRTEQKDYNFRITHNQNIDPTANLNVNFTFSSGSFYRNFSQNLNDILKQNIISNATLNKTWTESNRSLSVAVLRDQNLISNDVNETLPSISFNQGTVFPFRRRTGGSSEQAWYETIGLSYSANGQNLRSTQSTTLDSVKTGAGQFESLTEFSRRDQRDIRQNLSLSVSPKFGHVTISPSLSFSDLHSFVEQKTPVRNPSDSLLTFSTTRPKTVTGNLSAGVGASTRFYGIMQPNILGVTALRHTVNPSISFSYSKQVYGTQTGPYALTAGFALQNIFEMKYQPVDTVKEQKIQLMNVGASLSYNFRAPEFKLSDMAVNYRTNIAKVFDVSATTVYSFYVFDRSLGRRVNKFLINEKKYLADLTSVSFSLGTSLSGQRKGGSSTQPPPQETQDQGFLAQQTDITQGFYQDQNPDFNIPWNLGLNFTFSQNQANPMKKFRSASLQATLSFNLTEKWKFTSSGNYDLVQRKFAAPSIQISRDLHCWIMNFNWVPIGPYRYYRLEIRIKAPQLQDIKITKAGSERGVY
jgi:lipopolysaccharide assembly outer membrane protein LptD (OstA)